MSKTVAHIVDCGSGATRAKRPTEVLVDGVPILTKEKCQFQGERLAEALVDDAELDALLHLIATEIPEGIVLIGATAGVRSALEDGTVTDSHLKAFEEKCFSILESRAQFNVLSPEDEARCEWASVHYSVVHECAALELAGMISGGGMSCQLALAGDDPAQTQVFSWSNLVFEPGGLLHRVGEGSLPAREVAQGLEILPAAMAAKLPEVALLRGTYVVIEWPGYFIGAEKSASDPAIGLGLECALCHSDVLRAVEERLANDWPEEGEVLRHRIIGLVIGTLVKVLLRNLFHESAFF